jgi:lysozyme
MVGAAPMPRIPLQTRLMAALLAATALLGLPALATAKKSMGIDVSRFQEKIDWKKVDKDGVDFAFVQASRGDGNNCVTVPDNCGRDKWWSRNYDEARKQNIPVGPYHRAFFDGGDKKDAKKEAKKQAKIFLKEVGDLKKGDLKPVLDFESNGGGSAFGGFGEKELKTWIQTWLDEVEDELGTEPIIYTNNSSWQSTGDTESFAKAGYLLWVADFDAKKPLVPAGNWGGKGWSVWQYTSSGRVDGIDGPVDENKARVNLKKLEA